MARVREHVEEQPEAPAHAAIALHPLTRLLELAAAGIPLTQNGYIVPEIVRQLATEFGWWDEPRQPRSETDVHQLRVVRALARKAGLVRRSRSNLLLTSLGQRARSSPQQCWRCLTRDLAAGTDFTATLRELLLARLLAGPGEFGTVEEELHPSLQETGWRLSTGDPITLEALRWSMWDAVRPLAILNIISVGDWQEGSIALTAFGIPTAAQVLWGRATAPQSL